MQERNPLARSAQGVLRAIVARFKKAIASSAHNIGDEVRSSDTPASDGKSTTVAESTPPSSLETGGSYTYPQPSATNQWTVSPLDDLTTIAPMFPTSDLIYNDLNAIQGESMEMPPMGEEPVFGTDGFAWQFGGDLGDDTLWQFLNQSQPGATGDGLG